MAKQSVDTPEQERSQQEYRSVAVGSGGAAAQNTLRNIRLIIGREYKNRLTQRSFIIVGVILLVIAFLAPFIPTVGTLTMSPPPLRASVCLLEPTKTRIRCRLLI